MPAYYNEYDPFAAQWLRNLITRGAIAPGDVDERSIEDVVPGDLAGYSQCHFFAGLGVWSYALRQVGWADDRPVWTGSCPCQPFSEAGKGGGFADERHLWPAWYNLIEQCRPSVIFGEQVEAAIRHGWLDLVHTELEDLGYAFGSATLPACGFGAPHIRQRLYWVGDANYLRLEGHTGDGDDQHGPKREVEAARGSVAAPGRVGGFWADAEWLEFSDGKRRPVQPGSWPMAPRSATHMERCSAYGNAICAEVAQEFVSAYMGATA